ncbi:hypothetical protein AALO_G00118620 [Alosa alosa]|uniref:Uncharacterized protein n=1 Tax=Alosa alosa TaxID=278164 RepID=A0AAV6GSR9_9TELE|nr:hypothetical protein AALO_G00118620 [Alosa alosa]
MVFIGTSLKSVLKYFKRKAVSSLDEESKWTVHYSAPWHQQENVFLPASRPACVEDLHRQAKVNLKTVLRECDKLRKDGFRSSQYYSQGPMFSGPAPEQNSQPDDDDDADDIDRKSAASSMEEENSLQPMRAQTPVQGEGPDTVDAPSSTKGPALPTPEERMRQQAQAVITDIVPINVTAAVPGRGGELRPQSMFLPGQYSTLGPYSTLGQYSTPGQYSTLGRSGSVSSGLRRSDTRDSGVQTEEVKIVPPSVRRIRAQRGQGIAAQMAGMREDRRASSSSSSSSRQIGRLQVDDSAVHLRSTPRPGALGRPRSQEVRGTQSEWGGGAGGPACVVSPHAAYSTSIIPNATLSCSAEVIALHTAPSNAHLPPGGAPPPALAPVQRRRHRTPPQHDGRRVQRRRPGAQLLGRCVQHHRSARRCGNPHPRPQARPIVRRPPVLMSAAASGDEHWIYDTAESVATPRRPLTSSCSTPLQHLPSSYQALRPFQHRNGFRARSTPWTRTATTRPCTWTRGCGPRARAVGTGWRAEGAGGTAFQEAASPAGSDRLAAPPSATSRQRCPRQRSDRGGRRTRGSERVADRLSAAVPAAGPEGQDGGVVVVGDRLPQPVQRLRGPVDAASSQPEQRQRGQQRPLGTEAPVTSARVHANVYALCHITPAHSDTSSLRSDYADSWGYYMDYSDPARTGPGMIPGHRLLPAPAAGRASGKRPGEGAADGDAVHGVSQATQPHGQGRGSQRQQNLKQTPSASSPGPA